jgi:hypothetical protein
MEGKKSLESLESTLLSILRNMTHVDAQNKLMACTDREIAVAILYMNDDNREFIFTFLAQSKIERINEEIKVLKKKKITDERYRKIITRLIKHLKGEGSDPRGRSYFKPRK